MILNVKGQWNLDLSMRDLVEDVRAALDALEAEDEDAPGPHYCMHVRSIPGGSLQTVVQLTREGIVLEQRVLASQPGER